MTTSKRISLLFAGYVTVLILIFGVIINIGFFLSRYRIITARSDMGGNSDKKIDIMMNESPLTGSDKDFHDIRIVERFNRPMWNNQQPLVFVDQELIQEFSRRHDMFDFVKYNNQIWHYTIMKDSVILVPIDGLIDSQFLLIYVTLACTFLLACLSYFVSLMLVQYGLKPLYTLTHHIKQVKDPEEYENVVVGPDHDELQQVSSAFTHAMDTIATQTKNLKQFVSHASHELKTPLMTISSAADVLKKKGNETSQLITIKETTQSMKYLIDRLMTTMRQDMLHKEQIDIIPLVRQVINQEKELHQQSHQQLSTSLPDMLIIPTDRVSLESILTNLITNAYKYAEQNSPIELKINAYELTLSNAIASEHIPDIDLIREPFYRADESRADGTSHGLGLTIVRQLVERLGWTIIADLKDNRILFTLMWSD